MKTDSIEIFQTIRAAMQPYTTLGFTAKTNAENAYDLWSEKNVVIDGKKKSELHFAEVKVVKDAVQLEVYALEMLAEKPFNIDPELAAYQVSGKNHFVIKQLDENLMQSLTEVLEHCYQIFKQKEWV